MSYGGKSVYRPDMRRVMCWFMGVCECASHADELKNGGRIKYMCQPNANLDNMEGLHVFQPSCAACIFNSITPLP